MTDYQRGNFSVFQARFEEPMAQRVVPILPPGANRTADSPPDPTSTPKTTPTILRNDESGLGLPKTAGIIVGAISGCLLLLTLCCLPWILRRHRRQTQIKRAKAIYSSAEDIRRTFAANSSRSQCSANQSYPSLRSLKGVHGLQHTNIPEIDRNSRSSPYEVHNDHIIELPENTGTFERSPSVHGATLNQTVNRPGPARPPNVLLSPRRRHGMVLSTSGMFSTGNIVKHRIRVNGLRASQSDSSLMSRDVSVANQPIHSYLERPLPSTPIDESPQSDVFPPSAWIKIATRRHKHQEEDLYPPPLRTQDNSVPHRRGFF